MVAIGFNISSGFSISGTLGQPDTSAFPSASTGRFTSGFPWFSALPSASADGMKFCFCRGALAPFA